MRNILTRTMGAIMLSALAIGPALADDSAVKNVYMFPVRALSLASGCAVGTPIAAVRLSVKDTKQMFSDASGGGAGKKVMGTLVALPVGVFEGSVQGCYYGTHNAIKNCVEKPFSKDSFSLGELGE